MGITATDTNNASKPLVFLSISKANFVHVKVPLPVGSAAPVPGFHRFTTSSCTEANYVDVSSVAIGIVDTDYSRMEPDTDDSMSITEMAALADSLSEKIKAAYPEGFVDADIPEF
jgi:hypothetical protein